MLCDIEASPKEMYWARLAEKRAAEIGEYFVRDQKNLPKSVYELAIVGCMRQIPTEWNCFRDLVRHICDANLDAGVGEQLEKFKVELCDRHWPEHELATMAIAHP